MLLKTLQQQGYDIWIYTSSQRPLWHLKLWFLCLGIPLDGAVNLRRHHKVLQSYPSPINGISKYPPAFEIDLLVDDSEGVVLEGQRYNFAVIHIKPDDERWTETLQEHLSVLYEKMRSVHIYDETS